MTTVTIVGADRALAAGMWCLDNYEKDEWSVDFLHIMNLSVKPEYNFTFSNPKKATEFILRWQ